MQVGKELQAELRSAGIPFNEHGVSFWRRKIVKQVVAALRIVACRCVDGLGFDPLADRGLLSPLRL